MSQLIPAQSRQPDRLNPHCATEGMSPHTGTFLPPRDYVWPKQTTAISIRKVEILWDIKKPPLSNDGHTAEKCL